MPKVLIQIGNGNLYLPQLVPPRIIARGYPYNRMGEVVSIMEREGAKNRITLSEYVKNNGEMADGIYNFSDNPEYYAIINNKELATPVLYRIKTVSTFRPWCISYSGAHGEYIKYFRNDDEIVITDKTLNYCSKIQHVQN